MVIHSLGVSQVTPDPYDERAPGEHQDSALGNSQLRGSPAPLPRVAAVMGNLVSVRTRAGVKV